MTIRLRERWPLLSGVAAAIVLLALSVLDLAESGWYLALAALALFLTLQLVLNGRLSLRRERRLVETGAALREATARLEQLAATDALTGLANRRVFDERLGEEFRRSRRYGRPLAVLMIDLDHFKRVNDEYGHPFGDLVLVGAAEIARASLREFDLVARYGGEEFVVLLPETGVDAALAVAEKLRSGVSAREFERNGTSVRTSVSIGVAGLPDPEIDDEHALVARADEALYAAKRSGRDRVVLAPAGEQARRAS